MPKKPKILFKYSSFTILKLDSIHATSINNSLLQQVGDEINSTMAGRVMTHMAKKATYKISELLGRYFYPSFNS